MSAGQLWMLIGLGVFHGANPGMGWLIAVSRGLQEGGRRAVVGALPAIAAGHAASIAVVAVVITVTGSVALSTWFAIGGGVVVTAAGLALLLSRSHFHWTGVRMGLGHLAAWSFLMSSVHGAGLMLLPVLAGRLADGPDVPAGAHHGGAAAHPAAPAAEAAPAHQHTGAFDLWDATLLGLGATAVHTAAMFAAAGVVALVVHDFFGVNALRLSWVTMDRLWAFTLVGGGVFVLWGTV
ncbi:hypothetical protein CLV63_102316 [Murinocardiopsis flavida]|uniref:Cell wall anchor protein n=1 Tax=Murinocardiopsis flavida TaxID=645275 RepID=A0A2P8DSI6_9ACTN|nr:cell wall anchor protein [Murinocardiopsis flavida]PSL00189.1 hypothetical protein CLV63_102316 [Murinocardiopsis flavida]